MQKNVTMLGIGFLAGTICATLAYKILKNTNKLNKPNITSQNQSSTIKNSSSNLSAQQYESDPQYQQLKHEQLARIIKFFGQQKYKKLQNSFVIVFGIGGVGSHVVNMLARSGVKRIRIIDFDTISMSSLNRHSFAVREDVGTSKVQCIAKYVHKIFPHINIQCVNVYATVDNVKKLLINNYQTMNKQLATKQKYELKYNNEQQKPSYIIDCIDNLDAKVQLISVCLQNKLKLIVSGGAGMKSDPTKLQIRDIVDCKYDKLIMRIKRQLTKKSIKSGIKVCYSYQQSQKQLLPLTQQQQTNPQAYKVFDNYRIRIIPVLGTMPAIIGMSIASYVLCQLADQKYQTFQTDYVKSSAISKLYNQLNYQIRKRGLLLQYVLVDIQQVSILAKKVYKWKCLVHQQKKGQRLAIWNTDWNKYKVSIDNLALLCKQCYENHNKKINQNKYSKQIIERFQSKAKYAKQLWDNGYMMFI